VFLLEERVEQLEAELAQLREPERKEHDGE